MGKRTCTRENLIGGGITYHDFTRTVACMPGGDVSWNSDRQNLVRSHLALGDIVIGSCHSANTLCFSPFSHNSIGTTGRVLHLDLAWIDNDAWRTLASPVLERLSAE